MVNLTDKIYESDPENCHMIVSPLTGAVYKRGNSEVHKFLKSLTQVTEAWKGIEKCRGGLQEMKSLREHYYIPV